jgi:hypothetical protein
MSAIVNTGSPKTNLNNPSRPALVIGSVLGTGIGMAAHFAKTSAIYYPVEKFELCTAEQRINWSVHAALSVPIRPITSFCFTKILGCNKDTNWRNVAEYVATTVTTSIVAAAFCNYAGYDVHTAGIVYSHLQAFGLELATTGFKKGIEFIDDKIESMKQTVSAVNPDRVKPFQMTTSEKTEKLTQLSFDEMEFQSGLLA